MLVFGCVGGAMISKKLVSRILVPVEFVTFTPTILLGKILIHFSP